MTCTHTHTHTDVADEDDFSVGRDMLGETGLLLIPEETLVLAGGVSPLPPHRRQVEGMEPALCPHCHYKVLMGGDRAEEFRFQIIIIQRDCAA